jgi:hypothetical protein
MFTGDVPTLDTVNWTFAGVVMDVFTVCAVLGLTA